MEGRAVKIDPASAPLHRAASGAETRHLSDAGGLTQFGCYLETLPPGAASSDRHWHSAEDEFLFLLSGDLTLTDNFGAHPLRPGDAVCWPHGEANAHHLLNHSDQPCRYVILGSRVEGDTCHYPDLGRRMINTPETWSVVADDGTVLRGGDLPPHLLNLPPVWGQPASDPARSRILPAASRAWEAEAAYAHPILGGGLGPYRHSVLGDAGGLSQFGVHLEELPPGSRSSFRHWHETEDEMILMLSGEVVLVEDDETPLGAGEAACWPAGSATGHQLANRSDRPALYLTIGTRHRADVIHYPDHDLITHKDGPARRYLHRDGTPYPQGGPQ
jgi:uncharacterized cupin superfamily protein